LFSLIGSRKHRSLLANADPSRIPDLWLYEPVSIAYQTGLWNAETKLENREQRPASQNPCSRAEILEIAEQRLEPASLSRRNVGGTHTPGNDTPEAALPGLVAGFELLRSTEAPASARTGDWPGRRMIDFVLRRLQLQARLRPRGGLKFVVPVHGWSTVAAGKRQRVPGRYAPHTGK
jgi:hypothetical protein